MTTGRPAPGYGIRILHPDRTPVAPGETGHLECWGWRGIQMFLEYLNNPQATADSFTPDGWFITGDRVTLEADGYVTFADRDKDMLKVGGGERRRLRDRARDRAGARRLRVRRGGAEAPHAGRGAGGFRHRGAGIGAAARAALPDLIVAECRAKLADFKVPRAVFVVEDMPRSTLEKIHKAELRKTLPVAG